MQDDFAFDKKNEQERLIKLVNSAIDETNETISCYVNEWMDSSSIEKEKAIEDLKEEFRKKILNL